MRSVSRRGSRKAGQAFSMWRRDIRATQINFAIILKLWLPLLLPVAAAAAAATPPDTYKWNENYISVRSPVEFCIIKIERQTMKTMSERTTNKNEKKKEDQNVNYAQ